MKRSLLFLALLPAISYANSDFDKFIEDGDLKFTYRMDYIYLMSDKYGFGIDESGWSDYDQRTWAQSGKIAYKSGYYKDHFGFDLDLYGVDPIGEGTQGVGFTTREILHADDNGNATGFTKLSQAVLKQKFMVNDFSVELFEGRRTLKEYGGTSAEDNAATSSYKSITSEVKSDEWNIKLGYLLAYSDSDEIEDADFKTADGDDIDYIITADATYTNGVNSYRYYITESQGYLRKQQLRYSHSLGPDSWVGPAKLTATIHYEEALSNYDSMGASSREFDDYAALYSLDADFFFSSGFAKIAYNYTDANKEGTLGKYAIHMASSTTGSVQGSQDIITSGNAVDYHNDKEHVFAFMTFYDMSPSVTLGVDYRVGFFDYANQIQIEDEISVVGVWHPQSIPNLSISAVIARDNNIKVGFDNTPLLVNGKTVASDGRAFVSTIKYTF